LSSTDVYRPPVFADRAARSSPRAMAFSPDGMRLAVIVWDLAWLAEN